MATLHIEHPITDYPTWRAAFDRFGPARTNAGVRAHRVWQPHDDQQYVVLQLDFDDAQSAGSFLEFLRSAVWATPEASPALAGTPQAQILEPR